MAKNETKMLLPSSISIRGHHQADAITSSPPPAEPSQQRPPIKSDKHNHNFGIPTSSSTDDDNDGETYQPYHTPHSSMEEANAADDEGDDNEEDENENDESSPLHQGLQRLVLVAAATAATLGYDVGIMAAAIQPMEETMELNSIQKELAMGSLNFVAAIVRHNILFMFIFMSIDEYRYISLFCLGLLVNNIIISHIYHREPCWVVKLPMNMAENIPSRYARGSLSWGRFSWRVLQDTIYCCAEESSRVWASVFPLSLHPFTCPKSHPHICGENSIPSLMWRLMEEFCWDMYSDFLSNWYPTYPILSNGASC